MLALIAKIWILLALAFGLGLLVRGWFRRGEEANRLAGAGEIAAARSRLQEAEAERSRLKAKVAELNQLAEDSGKRAARAEERLRVSADSQGDIAALKRDFTALQAQADELAAAAEEADALRAKLAELEASDVDVAQLQARIRQLEAQTREVPVMEAEIARLRTDRDQGDNAEIERLREELRRAQDRESEAIADARSLRERLRAHDGQDAELSRLRAEVTNLRAQLSRGGPAEPADLEAMRALADQAPELNAKVTALEAALSEEETARREAERMRDEVEAKLAAGAGAEEDAANLRRRVRQLEDTLLRLEAETDAGDAAHAGNGAPEPVRTGPSPFLDAPDDGAPDDLKQIKGVGPKLERMLHGLGVFYFRQIASWSPEQVDEVDQRLRFRGRITRDDWVAQAQDLAGGEATADSQASESA